ncbi:MAG: hypothetical protein IOB85_12655 [Methylobacterium sp.]|nr:hypothetical protein [Methylobacterium sp.]MCA3654866.1 hypothetical protein [Methylobacterium sp.]MCA3658814.1 hypothetical protein [Methylobacterium sp.]MCA3660475.1 hypothetical protein [Methylobacterium sp.]MCA3666247.1 hypothetical protein [Methylobacterium sp.]
MSSALVIARNDVTNQSRLYSVAKQLPFLDCRVGAKALPRNDAGGTIALIIAGLSPSLFFTGLDPVIQNLSGCIPGGRPGMTKVR